MRPRPLEQLAVYTGGTGAYSQLDADRMRQSTSIADTAVNNEGDPDTMTFCASLAEDAFSGKWPDTLGRYKGFSALQCRCYISYESFGRPVEYVPWRPNLAWPMIGSSSQPFCCDWSGTLQGTSTIARLTDATFLAHFQPGKHPGSKWHLIAHNQSRQSQEGVLKSSSVVQCRVPTWQGLLL